MKEEIFQNIFDIIQPLLIDEWKKMILFIGYTKGSFTMKFYTSDDNGVFTDCFSQNGANKIQIINAFISIDKILSPVRKELSDENRWTVMTMTVTSDGEMHTEFDYDDISENAIAYESTWVEKYVK